MNRLYSIMDVIYDKHINYAWDTVWLISGEEGSGKSTLAFHMYEYWCKKRGIKITPEHLKYIAMDKEQFMDSFRDMDKYNMIVDDEAGDVSNKNSMTTFNKLLAQTYQVIRAHCLFTVFIIPSIFDLEGFFTKRRARGLIHVHRRGAFGFWNRERLRKIVDYNAGKLCKRITVKPLFVDTFPKYHGILHDVYQEKKALKMTHIRQDLYDEYHNRKQLKSNMDINTLLVNLKANGVPYATIAKAMDCHPSWVGKLVNSTKIRQESDILVSDVQHETN